MRKKNDMKPKKCWNCAYLGKCELLEPCAKFKEYDYKKNEIGTVTKKQMASKLNITRDVLQYRLSRYEEETLKQIKEITGKEYIYDYYDDKSKIKTFIEIYNY